MRWLRVPLLALPFAVAAVLNVLMWASDHHSWPGPRLFRYVFLFALPWARLLGRLPVLNPHSHILQVLLGYAFVLWIPAALYCFCLWIVLRIVQSWITLFHQHDQRDATPKGTDP